MAVAMLYFAWVREAVGAGGETVEPPASALSVSDLLDWLSEQSAGHASAFIDRDRLRAAIDQVFVPMDAPIAGASEIAIFPPVTGG